MKTVEIKLQLFELYELSKEAQTKAINDTIGFMENTEQQEGDYEIDEYSAVALIEINQWLYYKNGELADITHYVGKHELAGQTWLELAGDVYLVENKKQWHEEK